MTPSAVNVANQGPVQIVTFDRPACLNALDAAMRAGLVGVLQEASRDDAVGAIVVTGRGERAFCAGQDLNESAALAPEDGYDWMAGWKAYFEALSVCAKPIIAAVNGVAAGAGLETALLADIRIATPDARFLLAEINIGLPAIVGGCLLTTHLGHSTSVELTLSGREFGAQEAYERGLLRDVVPRDVLLSKALALAEELAAKPPVAMRLTLSNLRRQLRATLAEADRASVLYQAEAVATGDPQRVMADFLAARAARRLNA